MSYYSNSGYNNPYNNNSNNSNRSRAAKLKLYEALKDFHEIVDSHGRPPQEISPLLLQTPIDMSLEEDDPLQSNEIVFQFLGFTPPASHSIQGIAIMNVFISFINPTELKYIFYSFFSYLSIYFSRDWFSQDFVLLVSVLQISSLNYRPIDFAAFQPRQRRTDSHLNHTYFPKPSSIGRRRKGNRYSHCYYNY